MRPIVVLIGIGGTIASIVSENGLIPKLTPEVLLKSIPELSDFCDIECKTLMTVDSSNLQPEDWIVIVKEIIKQVNRNDITGVVVTHGTDTLSFTATATAILTRNLGKPVVFTGSQIPMPVFGTDAKRNLIDAIRVATTTDIAESLICFDSRLFRGCRAVKLREYELNAFETVEPFPVAEISKSIDIIDPYIRPRTNSQAWFDGGLNPNVAMIKAFPGMSGRILEQLPNIGYEGVVIEGFGAGNLPIQKRSLVPAIEKLIAQNIPVVITTQCVFGRTEILVYETGKNFSDLGVISGYDMITEVAVIKLMWALHRTKDMEEIAALMHTNLAGEINPLIEQS